MSARLKLIDQGIISYEPGRGAYMPGILALGDGVLLAWQHVGSGLAEIDNRIEVLRSTDAGKTWVNQGCIHKSSEGWAYRGPFISPVTDGRLIMVATRFQMGADGVFDPTSESMARGELLVSWSTDSGYSWSEPEVVSVPLPPEKYTWNSTGMLLKISADRWMLPLETWKPRGWIGPPDQKAAALFSSDQGRTWGQFTIVADDTSGKVLWWDQVPTILQDGRLYTMFWTHKYGTSDDLNNHYAISQDQGHTWSQPRPTNLRGQVCAPIALPDGRVAAIYNYRHEPQGIHVALTEDLETFDVENEVVVFDAGTEATLGQPEHDNFLAEHVLIGFGKPGGTLLPDGDLLTYFWCTSGGVPHTRWVRLRT